MTHRYSTALSHLILAGTGIYCLSKYGTGALDFPHGTFGTIVVNSVIGIWRWGSEEHGHSVDGIYQCTTMVQTCFALPCMTTVVLLKYGYQWEIAYAATFVSLIPLVSYLCDRSSGGLLDLIIAVDSIAMGIIAFTKENYFGAAAAVTYLIAHFVTAEGNSSFEDVPTIDMYNYVLCFFTYFSLRTIMA